MSPQCQNCGGHVSVQFVRVFGRDDIDACPHCCTYDALVHGAGAVTEGGD